MIIIYQHSKEVLPHNSSEPWQKQIQKMKEIKMKHIVICKDFLAIYLNFFLKTTYRPRW
jgi:hypothetical protein